mgnify:CR=1 FL=1
MKEIEERVVLWESQWMWQVVQKDKGRGASRCTKKNLVHVGKGGGTSRTFNVLFLVFPIIKGSNFVLIKVPEYSFSNNLNYKKMMAIQCQSKKHFAKAQRITNLFASMQNSFVAIYPSIAASSMPFRFINFPVLLAAKQNNAYLKLNKKTVSEILKIFYVFYNKRAKMFTLVLTNSFKLFWKFPTPCYWVRKKTSINILSAFINKCKTPSIFRYSRTLIIRTSIIRTIRLSGIFSLVQFFHEYQLIVILKTQSCK